MNKIALSINTLCQEAQLFAERESIHFEPSLFGITDGKAVGTYLEHKFVKDLDKKYSFKIGSSAKGIDLPGLGVDIKVTSIKQPQSSCPYESAEQKIFGLGYSLLLFVYEKLDNAKKRVSNLNILHTIYVDKNQTGDYQITRMIREMIQAEKDSNNNAIKEDIVSLLKDKNLPVDDIQANILAEKILESPPEQGYLTISNALQWRLQYSRVIQVAGEAAGVIKLK